MGLITGQQNYRRWQKGKRLTRQEAIEAQCYICNGGENVYCGGKSSCTIYAYSQFSQERYEKYEKCPPQEISALHGVVIRGNP